MQISSIFLSSFNSLADRKHKLKWGVQRKDLTGFFPPLVLFYLRGSGKLALVSEKKSSVCEFSPFFFFTSRANTFFGSLGLCFREQVDLLILWLAQAPMCMTSIQATDLTAISSWAYLVMSPSLPLLVHMGGHDGPLLSFSVLWE